jgi:hypothetical protein
LRKIGRVEGRELESGIGEWGEVEQAAQAAQAAGLYTARIHDEMFELTTPSGFAPRRWV